MQDTATTTGTLLAASCVATRLRALARRIEHDGIVVAQFLRHQRAAEQVARFGLHRLQAGGGGDGLLQRCHGAGIAVEGADTRLGREPQRERPDAAKEIGDMFCALAMFDHKRGKRFFARDRRLQERARRQCHLRGADGDVGRIAHQHQFAMTGQPRQPVFLREAGELCDRRRRQRTGAAHVDVEPALGGGDLDVERLFDRQQRFRQRPGRIERAIERGIEDRAAIDRDDVVRACGGKADLEHLMRAHPRMQRDAPPACAMRIDQRRHLAIDSILRQRLDHDAAFPGLVVTGVPMLDGAAAADAEMRAERFDPLWACALDPDQAAPVGMTGNVGHLDALATKRVRHIDIAAAGMQHAVAAMADMIDARASQPRRAPRKNSILPSPPAIEEGNTCMSVQPSEAANAEMSSQMR